MTAPFYSLFAFLLKYEIHKGSRLKEALVQFGYDAAKIRESFSKKETPVPVFSLAIIRLFSAATNSSLTYETQHQRYDGRWEMKVFLSNQSTLGQTRHDLNLHNFPESP